MKKLLFTLNLIIIFSYQLTSQNFEWVKGFYSSFGSSIRDLKVDSYGNIYTIGLFSESINCDPLITDFTLNKPAGTKIGLNFFISKFDKSGKFLWAKSIFIDENNEIFNLNVSSKGEIYITGNFFGTIDFDPDINIEHNLTSLNINKIPDVFILKLTTDGNFNWVKRIGKKDSNVRHNYSTLNINGDIIIAGSFMGEMDFDPNTSEKLFNSKFGQTYFISIDQDGNFKWLNQIENMFGNIGIYELKTDKKGNIYCRGNLAGTVDIDPSENTFNISWINMFVTCSYLSKSDSLGKFIWADVFPDKFEDYKYGFNSSFSIDNLQNIYRLSYNGILNDLDPGPDTFYLKNPIPFKINSAISKLDSDGKFLWAKQFISPKSNLIYAIENDNNDNILIVGSFKDTINFGTEANQIIYTSDNLFDNNYTTKLDKNGNHIWSYILKNRTYLYNKIICDSSDNLHYIGTYKEKTDFDNSMDSFYLPTYPENIYNAFLLKLNSEILTSNSTIGKSEVKIFPNPTNGKLNIEISKKLIITLYNIYGQNLLNYKIEEGNNIIDLNGLSSGLYLLKIENTLYKIMKID